MTLPPGGSLEERLRGVLRAHISEILARSILSLSVSRAGVDLAHPRPGDSQRLLAEFELGVRLYVSDAERRDSCLRMLGEALQALPAPAVPKGRWLMPVEKEDDIVTARTKGAEVCRELGFSLSLQIKVATVISELARNIVQYAGNGEIKLTLMDRPAGIEVVATDRGPGIPDVDRVLSPTYKSKTGMGIGLRGSRNLVDQFEIRSTPGQGTEVRVRKHL